MGRLAETVGFRPREFGLAPRDTGQALGAAIERRITGAGRLGFKVLGDLGGGGSDLGGLDDRRKSIANDGSRAAAQAARKLAAVASV
jgi:hypothetical protein